MDLKSEASLQILKPLDIVFEGIVNPEKMTKYFISESTGRMETGKDLLWKFPEFPDRFPITQVKVEPLRSIAFVWDPETLVEIQLEAYTDDSTIVKVTEGSKSNTPDNLKWLVSNSGGWANFLACMKAYLEHGIGLRKGAYDFMRKQ